MTHLHRHTLAGLLCGIAACATVVCSHHVAMSEINTYLGIYLYFMAKGAGLLMLIILFCIALVTGLREPYTWPTAVVGLVLGTVAGMHVTQAQDDALTEPELKRRAAYEAEQLGIVEQLQAGDLDTLPTRLASLQHGTFETTVCEGLDGATLARRNNATPSGLTIATPRLLRFADVVASSALPQSQKTVALFAVLSAMSDRSNAAEALPRWMDAWRIAHADPSLNVLRIEPEFRHAGVCQLGSTVTLAEEVANGMGDAGIDAWLAHGFTFLPEQHHLVLRRAKNPSTVRALVQSGIDLNKLEGTDGKPRSLLYDQTVALFENVQMLRPDHLAQIANLMENYVALGADIGVSPSGQTACEHYRSEHAVACPGKECDFVALPLLRIERAVCGSSS